MKKELTSNQFTGGLMQDLSPMVTPNNVLTDCLNGTIITFNGNEGILQNDMGNGRVETAFLPEGYIPLGTCSHGGFIYIVSYNPIKNLSQIGSFPSPERNIDSTELKNNTQLSLNNDDLYILTEPKIEGLKPLNPLLRKEFANITLQPGDKFIIFANNLYGEYLSDFGSTTNTIDSIPRLWKIRPCSIQNNKTTELTNLKWYDTSTQSTDVPKYINGEILNSATDKEYTIISKEQYNELGGKDNLILQEDGNNYTILSSFNYKPNDKQTLNIKLLGEKVEVSDTSQGGSYYIKQIEGDLSGKQDKPIDVDEYRSLVCGAYSVFSSKKSGNLGLLISPEAPETFTSSFNVFKRNDNYDIYINSSWNNQGRDVHPQGILVQGKWVYKDKEESFTKKVEFNLSRNSFTDSYENFDTRVNNWINTLKHHLKKYHFINGYVIEGSGDCIHNNGIKDIDYTQKVVRIYNNGLPDLLSSSEAITESVYAIGTKDNYQRTSVPADILNNKYHLDVPYRILNDTEISNIETHLREGQCILKLTIYPYSEAGYFPWLKNELEIDFSKVGKQDIKLTEWRYYVNNNELILDWSLDAYTLAQQKINSVWLEFYDNYGLCATHILDNLSSYNSDFHTLIDLSGSPSLTNIKVQDDGIENTIIYHPGRAFSIINSFNDDGITVNDTEGIINPESLLIYNKDDVHESKDEVLGFYEKDGQQRVNPCLSWELIDNQIDLGSDHFIDLNTYTNFKFFLNDAGILYYGLPYLVKIKYKISNISTWGDTLAETKTIDTYRWLWTCPVLNEYFEGTKDFGQIESIDLTLDIMTQFNANENYVEKKAHINNSKLYSRNKIENISDNVSANVLYVGSLDTTQPNIDVSTTPMLKNEFNTFKLDESALNNISLDTAIKVYNRDGISSVIREPEQIEYISEYDDGNQENLKTINTIILDNSSVIPQDVKNFLEGNVSTVPTIKNNDNKYKLILASGNSNKNFTYLNSLSQIINNETLECNSQNFSTNILTNKLSFEAINYSKYYTTGSGLPEVKQLYTLKPFISSVDDMEKYNLMYDFTHARNWKKQDILYGYFGDEDEVEKDWAKSDINNYIFFNRLVSYAVSRNKSKTKGPTTNLILYKISNSDTAPQPIIDNGKGGSADVKYINESSDLAATKNEILKQCKLFFPVTAITWDSPVGTMGNTHVQTPIQIDNFKEYIKEYVDIINIAIANGSASGLDVPPEVSSYAYTTSQNEGQIAAPIQHPWWGGFLGFTTEDTIEINYYQPLVAYYKSYENAEKGWIRSEFGNALYGTLRHYNGNILTDYAHCVFSLLTQIGTRSQESHNESIYVYDKYVYCSEYKDKFTSDIIQNISCSNNVLNNLIITKVFTSNEESQSITYLNLQDYINSINKSVVNKQENKNDNYKLKVNLNSFTKTFPIQFEFNYISPEIQEMSWDGVTSITDCTGNIFLAEDISENQIYKIEENSLSELTESTKFYRTDIQQEDLTIIKPKNKYFDITYSDTSHMFAYDLPSMHQYVKYFTCPISQHFEVINGELRINEQAEQQSSVDGIYPTYKSNSIYNLTGIDIFYFNGLKTRIDDPNNIKK